MCGRLSTSSVVHLFFCLESLIIISDAFYSFVPIVTRSEGKGVSLCFIRSLPPQLFFWNSVILGDKNNNCPLNVLEHERVLLRD